ncbi:MAG: hypothetical protein AB1582_10620 [Pseudomonadota bacterium]
MFVNELILDSGGKINAVIIGIGGFLGMGEHDIAVSINKLQFREKEVGHTSSAATTTSARRRLGQQRRLQRPEYPSRIRRMPMIGSPITP